jgi:hypothetical protein
MKPPHRLFAACYQGAMRESADIARPTIYAGKLAANFAPNAQSHGLRRRE